MQRKRSPKQRQAAFSSESTEDHLERIAELVEDKGYACVTDVAEKLELNPSTVSNMVRRLATRGFLNYERYRGFSLTPDGRAVAARIKVRHKILFELLSQLGLSEETIEQEVEEIEHHLRPQTLEVLGKLVNYWKAHPAELDAFLRFSKKK